MKISKKILMLWLGVSLSLTFPGGAGAVDLAKAVVDACEQPSDFKFLYPLDISIKEKIEIIAKQIYGADAVTFEEEAERKIAMYTKQGFAGLPICMAKTHLSLSADATKKGDFFHFFLRIFVLFFCMTDLFSSRMSLFGGRAAKICFCRKEFFVQRLRTKAVAAQPQQKMHT
jgi:formyltetrahydrofolate synthetase